MTPQTPTHENCGLGGTPDNDSNGGNVTSAIWPQDKPTADTRPASPVPVCVSSAAANGTTNPTMIKQYQ
ncbi:hypothetical protein VY88_33200 [Azospirillum thiophilum]|uniref:Uncharacterized protein n=1 Tax=Azospirillum thiophilum TaxID=528244 RepID=A0AAC8ZWJ5_9PROT|nr:hypothetical protein [Azospirillum thiophilum]ALG75743.1 hypothetical protein AL072_32950 [Azospirillum thiophilum]KJR61192.1 hypothetical protein VY88_33200 [Azospirillum thiophilum]